MKTIWKFPLAAQDRQVVSMPAGAKVLSVGVQHESVCLWAEVDTEAPREERTFVVIGTGNPIPEGGPRTLLGRLDLAGGHLIFHVFEETEA